MDRESPKYEPAPLQRLYDYWRSKRGGGRLPGRGDLDPIEIPDLLPGLILVDVVCGGQRCRYRFRLFGTELVTAVRQDLTGRWLDEIGDMGRTDPVIASYDEVVTTGRPHAWRNILHVEGREHVGYRRLVCPLAADGKTVDMLVGVFVFERARIAFVPTQGC